MSAMDLSDFINEIIKKRGIKVSKLAERSGLSAQAIRNIRKGEVKEPSLSTFVKLSKPLGVHPLELIWKFFEKWEFSPNEPVRNKPLMKNDKSIFVQDVTYPDNTIVSGGQVFEKTWKIKNIGKVEWVNRKLISIDSTLKVEINNKIVTYGLTPQRSEVSIPNTKPNESVEISVVLIAPHTPCSVISHWKMYDEENNPCFPSHSPLYCQVIVA